MSGPKHPAAQRLVACGFFQDLQSFAQLEGRINALRTPQERGDAFEVFVEAYLATQRSIDAKAVWPFDQIPRRVRTKRSLDTVRDMGVDGVYETNLGGVNAYQAKFRAGRPALRWEELATFMGLTEQVDERVLLTNSNDLPTLMNDRSGFFCVRGVDLDRLESSDLVEMASWLESGSFAHSRKTPRDYQREAIEAITKTLAAEDRTTIVLACGTGKTLIGLWVAEQVAHRSVLVLEPSLALIRQTLHEWAKQASWEDCGFLCVCSDPSVAGEDSIIVRQTDLDFPVTTDPKTVARFLRSSRIGKHIVFSTYQSAHVLAEALPEGFRFDLGLFDEAHKTAGREGSQFAFALQDKHLPIGKRVFMTATPRHYDVTRKDEEGDVQLVYSMDAAEVYGSRAYTLSFRQAADRDIICDYKVLISVVTNDVVNDELLMRGEVVVRGDIVKARQVANQIALQRAVEDFDVRRIFSFHRNVKAAQSFVARGGEGVGSHLPGFSTYHVNGTMRTADRDELIKEFREAERGIMTNARCLTEGVDVPAVDMVAFMSPKKSKIDIVQAVGRAMRKAGPEKKVGYVLVPLYLEQVEGETIGDAIERTDFGEVWNVLGAMQEQDEELAEVIRQMRTERGRTKGYDDGRFRERVTVLGPEILLSALRESITVACIDRLGVAWDERLGELIAYKHKHGDCNVSTDVGENRALGDWVSHQRTAFKRNQLSAERTERLNELRFVSDLPAAAWEEMFTALVAYKQKHRDCNVSQDDEQNKTLSTWVGTQRTAYRRKQLSAERTERLDELGFVWDLLAADWEQMFTALAAYKQKHRDCNVPKSWTANPELGAWVLRQRKAEKAGQLSAQRKRRLDELRFDWDPFSSWWEEMFAALAAYQQKHGDCNVSTEDGGNGALGAWVSHQRTAYKGTQLSAERIRRLDELGFVWDRHTSRWEERFAALVGYQQQHGDCNVSQSDKENEALSRWVVSQREDYKAGTLSAERIRRLDELGFVWDLLAADWEQMFTALAAYKQKHRDCNVSQYDKENETLSTWVGTQRRIFKQAKLSTERIHRLDELGFVWDAPGAAWEEMFAALVAYKQQHGDCNVPARWPENPTLGAWVANQRGRCKRGQLSTGRIQRLDAMGFVWDLSTAEWEQMVTALVGYKEKHGDCNVPDRWPESLALATWVGTRRRAHKAGKLPAEQIQRLDELGFTWDAGRAAWEEMFAALVAHKEKHGNCNVPQRWPENPALGKWVGNRRTAYKTGRLSAERIARLEALGFEWTPPVGGNRHRRGPASS